MNGPDDDATVGDGFVDDGPIDDGAGDGIASDSLAGDRVGVGAGEPVRAPRPAATAGDRLEALRALVRARHDGHCLDADYRGQAATYRWRCRKGHEFTASASNVVHRNSWCPVCAGNAPVGLERARAHAEARGGRVLDGERAVGRDRTVRFACARGHRFAIPLRECGIGTRAWCPACLPIEQGEARRAAFAADAAAVGHALLSERWSGARTPHDVRCPIGHRRRTTPEAFRRGDGACPVCRAALAGARTPAPTPAAGSARPTGSIGPTARAPSAARRLLDALGPPLALPRTERESPINVGQLRLLVLLDDEASGATGAAGTTGPSAAAKAIGATGATGADRFGARALDGHDQPTVDARLAYLRAKGLVRPSARSTYREAARHRPTPTGRLLVARLAGPRPTAALLAALDRACALPIGRREAPATAGHLAVLARVALEPEVPLVAIVGTTCPGMACSGPEGFGPTDLGTKPTVRSRLRWLERRGLVECGSGLEPDGANAPNRYRASPAGRALVEALAPPTSTESVSRSVPVDRDVVHADRRAGDRRAGDRQAASRQTGNHRSGAEHVPRS